jgi:hypothetical protein
VQKDFCNNICQLQTLRPVNWVSFRHNSKICPDESLYRPGLSCCTAGKTPITAADLLNDRVLPFFEEHEVKLLCVLTDRGSEFCGNPERHEYELYLAIEDVDHSRTKTKSPQTNLSDVDQAAIIFSFVIGSASRKVCIGVLRKHHRP